MGEEAAVAPKTVAERLAEGRRPRSERQWQRGKASEICSPASQWPQWPSWCQWLVGSPPSLVLRFSWSGLAPSVSPPEPRLPPAATISHRMPTTWLTQGPTNGRRTRSVRSAIRCKLPLHSIRLTLQHAENSSGLPQWPIEIWRRRTSPSPFSLPRWPPRARTGWQTVSPALIPCPRHDDNRLSQVLVIVTAPRC